MMRSNGAFDIWNKREIQFMVLLSFMLQVFLLLTGSIRRRKINVLLRGSIWLAYVGADLVAVSVLNLFSCHGEKLGSRSFGDTLPFLWVPFILVHLGGQDSITAFSIEDNNLWLRHLLNLGVQVFLVLYIFWKSMQNIRTEVLVPAALIFVSGIIKYGERIWALRSGSRGCLGKSSSKSEQSSTDSSKSEQSSTDSSNSSIHMCDVLETVLRARGLLVGRTLLQLKNGLERYVQLEYRIERYLLDGFEAQETKVKLTILKMELRMLFDLLYTKAMVLQSWSGLIFRFAAQVTMVIAFVLFLVSERHHAQNSNRVDVAISYVLFVGAIFMEAFSVAMVVSSLWTKAHLRQGSFLHMDSGNNARSRFMSDQYNKMMHWLAPYSIGQFNHTYFIFDVPKSKVICKVINALGMAEKWINLCYVKHVEAQDILEDIMKWFDGPRNKLFDRELCHVHGPRLNYTLCLPFEHLLYRLHIFTHLHISKHFDGTERRYSDEVIQLKKDCEKLSNYMYYLKQVHPSMLPVSSAGADGRLNPGEGQLRSKLEVLNQHVNLFVTEPNSFSPFEDVMDTRDQENLKQLMKDIKELWVRLLVYVAGKCSAELHARQLGNGGELLSFVWLLMLHRGFGDAATEVELLKPDDRRSGFLVSCSGGWIPRPEEPHHAFHYRETLNGSETGQAPLVPWGALGVGEPHPAGPGYWPMSWGPPSGGQASTAPPLQLGPGYWPMPWGSPLGGQASTAPPPQLGPRYWPMPWGPPPGGQASTASPPQLGPGYWPMLWGPPPRGKTSTAPPPQLGPGYWPMQWGPPLGGQASTAPTPQLGPGYWPMPWGPPPGGQASTAPPP